MKLPVKQLDSAKDLPLPAYMTGGAAGMDLYAAVDEDKAVQSGGITLVPTGLHIAVPEGYEAQIRPRSGLALNHGITLVNSPATIDSDYRGELKIALINLGSDTFIIRRGERIAQMVISKVERAELFVTDNLGETERGGGGFGHTGK